MNRTYLLLAATGLLALGAAVVGLPTPPAPPPPPGPSRPPPAVNTPLVQTQQGALTFEGRLSSAVLPVGPHEAYALLTVRAERPRQERRMPVNLALVIDRSGSMRGQKLSDGKRAARILVQRLEPGDRLAIAHYGSGVGGFPPADAGEEGRGGEGSLLGAPA